VVLLNILLIDSLHLFGVHLAYVICCYKFRC